jgi:hypothetical protein
MNKSVYVVTWFDKEKNNFGVHKRAFFDHNEATQVALSKRSESFNIESFVDECDLVDDPTHNGCVGARVLCENDGSSSPLRVAKDVIEAEYDDHGKLISDAEG